jgi:hypothetical protein
MRVGLAPHPHRQAALPAPQSDVVMLPDREPLRRLDGWHPVSVLRRLPPAEHDRQSLSRLLVAYAVFVGPPRVASALGRIELDLRRLEPKARMHARDPVLAEFAADMARAFDTLVALRPELEKVRARALNDGRPNAVGLQVRDLRTLLETFDALVRLASLAERPSPAGMSRARRALERSPEPSAVFAWVQRFWPEGGGPLIAVDPDLGRVCLRHADGRLAFDPAA